MNTYGPMKETLRRVAEYQGCGVQYVPGYGQHFYRITVEDGPRRVSDIFEILSDKDLNQALNVLTQKALG